MTNEVTANSPTLYERLGGEAALQNVVDLFYERVLADSCLAPFFAGIAMDRLRSHQYAFLSHACDGPRQYNGRSMARAHASLAIEQRHFDAVAGHLVNALHALRVNETLTSEVITRVARLAPQIVTSPPATAQQANREQQ